MRGAVRYEFELATKSKFAESSIIWRSDSLKTPTTAIPVALPWMTGSPYALWAHVRAFKRKGATRWSAPYGFNMRWTDLPRTQASPPGLVRWSTVEGATGYQVWFLGPRKRIATKTNVADEREHWTFHQDPSWTAAVGRRARSPSRAHRRSSTRSAAFRRRSASPSLKDAGGDTTGGSGATPPSDEDKAEAAALSPPLVDLWDNGWPEHRYYYTVVPVGIFDFDGDGKLEYWDTELPQDVCAAGRVFTFGKVSEAVVATSGAAPFVSGMSTSGRLFTATRTRPAVYGAPLVAWKPALGADRYEVQWSRKAYPWKKMGSIETPATSMNLPLTTGRWYYRVRGISLALPAGGRQMSWSHPVAIRVAKPVFKIVRR